MIPVALTIAGSDPSGGAGLQADLKVFHQHRVYGAAVVTLVTVQSTVSVSRVEVLDAGLVAEQIRAVVDDIPPNAVKTGALGSAQVVDAVASALSRLDVPVVVDPVMIATHGTPLVDEAAREALRAHLLPLATLVTPNAEEATVLAGVAVRDVSSARVAAHALLDMGASAVLVTGGHLAGPVVDVLVDAAGSIDLTGERIDTSQTHGTGCALSAAIAARLAAGASLRDAASGAKAWVGRAIAAAPGLGRGHGPLDLLRPVEPPDSPRSD